MVHQPVQYLPGQCINQDSINRFSMLGDGMRDKDAPTVVHPPRICRLYVQRVPDAFISLQRTNAQMSRISLTIPCVQVRQTSS